MPLLTYWSEVPKSKFDFDSYLLLYFYLYFRPSEILEVFSSKLNELIYKTKRIIAWTNSGNGFSFREDL